MLLHKESNLGRTKDTILEIDELLQAGLSNAAIAARMKLSEAVIAQAVGFLLDIEYEQDQQEMLGYQGA
jgi:DNA-binding NarL/FixJ family response regulator